MPEPSFLPCTGVASVPDPSLVFSSSAAFLGCAVVPSVGLSVLPDPSISFLGAFSPAPEPSSALILGSTSSAPDPSSSGCSVPDPSVLTAEASAGAAVVTSSTRTPPEHWLAEQSSISLNLPVQLPPFLASEATVLVLSFLQLSVQLLHSPQADQTQLTGAPSSSTADFAIPASVTPASVVPASVAPASVAPASVTAVFVTPTSMTPASVTPASVTPAFVTPASVTPASVTPASVNPASVTPASVTPAFVTPASVNPASVTPVFVIPASVVTTSMTPASVTAAFVASASVVGAFVGTAPVTPASVVVAGEVTFSPFEPSTAEPDSDLVLELTGD